MLRSAIRRISALERSIRIPITAERFQALVEERMRLTGASLDDASQSLIIALSEQDLERLSEEFMRAASGGDPVKLARLKRLAALDAGVPVDAEFAAGDTAFHAIGR